jgi:hypothetical protein
MLLGGCDALFDLNHLRAPDPGTNVDAALGTVIDSSITCVGGTLYGDYGTDDVGLMRICVPMTATGALSLDGDIDTDGAFCDVAFAIDSYSSQVCVKWGASITIGTIHATGSRALILVASDRITINGVLDVASHQGASARGAGGNWPGCPQSNGASGTSTNGGGGGAGGSFGTRGGSGGTNSVDASTGGRPPVALDRVRGGCEGGNGGDGPYTTPGGFGGRAGGAVYLIAGSAIELTETAVINASGQGGHGGDLAHVSFSGPGGGGGGAGSGGLIGLDAPLVMVASTATVFANGGGGGGGAAFSTLGGDGADPTKMAITSPAAGGTGSLYGGKGGSGAIATKGAGNGSNGRSGGGGGGGLGYIAIFTRGPAVTSGQFSPTPVTLVGVPPQ